MMDSSATAAALELLQIKHHQPSRKECRAVGDLLWVILRSTGDASSASSTSSRRCSPALLALDDDDAASQSRESAIVPFKHRTPTNDASKLPIPVANYRDEQFLSPLQCFVRQHCVEYFEATAGSWAKGRQTPVSEGRVGIRCAFCKHLPREQQASQATSFPNQITSINSSVVMLQCRHFPNCNEMPSGVRMQLAALRKAGSSAANSSKVLRQDYWVESAQEMGFVDTAGGVRFVKSDAEEVSSTNGERKELQEETTNGFEVVEPSLTPESTTLLAQPRLHVVSPFEPILPSSDSINYELLIKGSTLVTLDDRDLIPDHIFLALAQLVPCTLTSDDQIGVFRTRPIGYQGMCCRHCQGHRPGPGFGKFFPNSLRSLAQTTTSQTIVKHIAFKCKHVPKNIKDAVSILLKEANEDARPAFASKNSGIDDRPMYGSRRLFFQRIWDRLHSCQQAGTPATKTSNAFELQCHSFAKSNVVQPAPIRYAASSYSKDLPSNLDTGIITSSHSEYFAGPRDLFDHKARRVLIKSSAFLKSNSKKRKSAFSMVFSPIKKPKV